MWLSASVSLLCCENFGTWNTYLLLYCLCDVMQHQETAAASESTEPDQPTRRSPSSMLQAAGIFDPTVNRFKSFTSKFHKLINRDRWLGSSRPDSPPAVSTVHDMLIVITAATVVWFLLRSIGLWNSYFPACISEYPILHVGRTWQQK